MRLARDWRTKALLKRGFALVPGGEGLNYLFQRHVTRNLPHSEAKFRSMVLGARDHVENFRAHAGRDPAGATFYEFGAGWALTIPLSFWAQGVGRQVLVDVRPLAKAELINDAVDKFGRLPEVRDWPRRPERRVPARGRAALAAALQSGYGIAYRAPCDARDTGLAAASIDAVTSTNTLEHIPPADIPPILRECRRILRPDGVMSVRIDYQDHYSYFDRGLSVYNFLRCSDRAWAFCSPGLYYQNRLRHADYLALIEAGGFDLLEERRLEPEPEQLAALGRMVLAPRFRGRPLEELAVRRSLLVLRPRDPSRPPPPTVRAAYVFHG